MWRRAGVVGLMRTLALEVAPEMIQVNSVHPGPPEHVGLRSGLRAGRGGAARRFSVSRAGAGLIGLPCSARSPGKKLALAVMLTCWWILSQGASILDHVGLFQDLEEQLGVCQRVRDGRGASDDLALARHALLMIARPPG
jgi:hypothetical protein